MPKLVFLGTSNAIPNESHENTYMAVVGQKHLLLIDCANNPIVRFKQAGLNIHDLTDLFLTHFHPDHVAGVPSLLMSIWLMGRTRTLHIYGIEHTLERIRKIMEFYDWGTWPNFYPVEFHLVPMTERAPVFECEEFRVFSSPVHHIVPAIGLRIEFTLSGKAMVYSSDTEACEEIVRLGNQADVLIHEATGASYGHSSAAQAGDIAQKAKAKKLYLIHYPSGDFDPATMVNDVRRKYQGPVYLTQDFMELEF